MTTITTAFDSDHWQVVPKVATELILEAILKNIPESFDTLVPATTEDAGQVYSELLAAAPPAPTHADLDAMAHEMATTYPMAAIIRALDKAAPGIRHAFAPPSFAPPAPGAEFVVKLPSKIKHSCFREDDPERFGWTTGHNDALDFAAAAIEQAGGKVES